MSLYVTHHSSVVQKTFFSNIIRVFSSIFQSLSVTPSDRQRLIPGSPAPQSMTQSMPESSYRKRNINSPKISISPVEDNEDFSESFADKLVEVSGVGVSISHPINELRRKLPSTPMPKQKNSAKSKNTFTITSDTVSYSIITTKNILYDERSHFVVKPRQNYAVKIACLATRKIHSM